MTPEFALELPSTGSVKGRRFGIDDAPSDHAATPVAHYLARLAPGSRRAQASACQTMACLLSGGRATAADIPWSQLTYAHTSALRAALVDRYQPATVNRHLAALRGVLRACWRLGTIPEAVYRQAIDVPSVREEKGPSGRVLAGAETAQLFAVLAADTSPRGERDHALCAVLWAGGLRCEEAVRLTRADCAELPVLTIWGKGRRRRLIVLPAWAHVVLARWAATGPEGGPLFPSFARDGTRTTRALGRRGVRTILARRLYDAGIRVRTSPHDFRRTYATTLLARGADPLTVARLLGHADVRTTMRYDRRGLDAAAAAAALLDRPT